MFFSITVRRGNDAPRRFLARLTVDGNLLQMIVLNRPGALPGLDRFSQQPLHTLFTDPVAPSLARQANVYIRREGGHG
jgi:hypothetical protein